MLSWGNNGKKKRKKRGEIPCRKNEIRDEKKRQYEKKKSRKRRKMSASEIWGKRKA